MQQKRERLRSTNEFFWYNVGHVADEMKKAKSSSFEMKVSMTITWSGKK